MFVFSLLGSFIPPLMYSRFPGSVGGNFCDLCLPDAVVVAAVTGGTGDADEAGRVQLLGWSLTHSLRLT